MSCEISDFVDNLLEFSPISLLYFPILSKLNNLTLLKLKLKFVAKFLI